MTSHLTKPIRAIHFMVLAFLMTIGSQVSAFDPADLKKLKNTGDCVNCDLINADLRRTDLSDANLALANLSGADLVGANLENVNFYGAILNRANMRNANLRNANMDGVLFCDTVMPDGSIRLTNAMIYNEC
jgi:uncharacterized protein YjbI with pentapeptide repeats